MMNPPKQAISYFTSNYCKFILVICIFYYGISSFVQSPIFDPPQEYMLIEGIKPVESEIRSHVKSLATNKICLKGNWIAGLRFLPHYDDELTNITYSENGTRYQIKVPLIPEHDRMECEPEIQTIHINVNNPSADPLYADYGGFVLTPLRPETKPHYSPLSETLHVKSICLTTVFNSKWSRFAPCRYLIDGHSIAEMEYDYATATISPELLKAGTVVTYDIKLEEQRYPQ